MIDEITRAKSNLFLPPPGSITEYIENCTCIQNRPHSRLFDTLDAQATALLLLPLRCWVFPTHGQSMREFTCLHIHTQKPQMFTLLRKWRTGNQADRTREICTRRTGESALAFCLSVEKSRPGSFRLGFFGRFNFRLMRTLHRNNLALTLFVTKHFNLIGKITKRDGWIICRKS